MLVLQVHRLTIVLSQLDYNMSNTLPKLKVKILSLEGLECIVWCDTYSTRLTWQDLPWLTPNS